MLLYFAFFIYIILFVLFISLAALNTLRIQRQFKFNPKILALLSPLLLNFILSNYVFYALPPLLSTLFPAALCYFFHKKFESLHVVGITGGLASGKSVLLKQIGKNLKNIEIIDGNKIVADLLRKDCKGYKQILKSFEESKQHFINSLNKEISLAKFFCFLSQNPNNMHKYSNLISKMVNFSIIFKIIKSLLKKRTFIFVSFPEFQILNYQKYYCYPIVQVYSPEHLRIQRINKKMGYSDQMAIKILNCEKMLFANQVSLASISNSLSEMQLLGNFLAVINPLLKKKQSSKKS